MSTSDATAAVIGQVPVAVTGAGVSGVGIAALLRDLGVEVVLIDDNVERACSVDRVRGVDTETGATLVDERAVGLLITSPGWRPDSEIFRRARHAGVEVIGDVELCFRLDAAGVFGPRRTWLVITGTNGKTTTTAMLAEIMSADSARTGMRAQAVGNIGVSVADVLVDPERVDILVAELSSFQLHWSSQLIPDAGALLNLAEDHIDWHGSLANYAADKAKVLRAPFAVAGIDDALVRAEVERVRPSGVIGFTLSEPVAGQVGVTDGKIVDNRSGYPVEVTPVNGIQPPGPAGIYDALAATTVAMTQGVPPHTVAAALAGFTAAGHRGAVVHRATKTWIDNSKATNPHAADAALSGHDEPVTWIAGGQLKGADIAPLVAANARRLGAVGVLGVDGHVVAEAVAKHAPHAALYVATPTDPETAMDELAEFAVAQEPKVVLLAPAAASLDMFNGMAQRGDFFAEAARRVDDHHIDNPATEEHR